MLAGADSISGMDLLRHGGMDRAFTARRAPTTLGTHLRGYTFGHVRQLDAVASRALTGLAAREPGMGAAGPKAPSGTGRRPQPSGDKYRKSTPLQTTHVARSTRASC